MSSRVIITSPTNRPIVHPTTDSARLYSPPPRKTPIWMAAGGPQSATFAGRRADGLITSVKAPADALERAIGPFRASAEKWGRAGTVLTTRWCVLAGDESEAWEALGSMRGLRAPGRLQAVDPMVLRERADSMDRAEILGKYTLASDVEDLIEVYRPLVTEIGADYVAVQIASTNPDRTLEIVEKEVLPELRAMADS